MPFGILREDGAGDPAYARLIFSQHAGGLPAATDAIDKRKTANITIAHQVALGSRVRDLNPASRSNQSRYPSWRWCSPNPIQ